LIFKGYPAALVARSPQQKSVGRIPYPLTYRKGRAFTGCILEFNLTSYDDTVKACLWHRSLGITPLNIQILMHFLEGIDTPDRSKKPQFKATEDRSYP